MKDCAEDVGDNCRDVIEAVEKSTSTNERTKRDKPVVKSENEVPSPDSVRFNKRSERSAKEQEDPVQEQSAPRISLIKPPRILAKLVSPETKPSPTKHGERKSNIPIFKRSSKEFEDIRSPQESPKRSLIPQRYRFFLPFTGYNECDSNFIKRFILKISYIYILYNLES